MDTVDQPTQDLTRSLLSDPSAAFEDETFMGRAMDVLTDNSDSTGQARIEFVAALGGALFVRTHGVLRGAETDHDKRTVTLTLDAHTEELIGSLGEHLAELSDFLTKLSTEARAQSDYRVLLRLLVPQERGHGYVLTVNADGSVRALRLGGPRGVDVPTTVTHLEYALHDALYIDPETGWAWGWFPCGRSSCWKEDGHDGLCAPSGHNPHAHKEERA